MTKRISIMGAPDKGQGEHQYAKGTRRLACEDCKGPTFFAPSSLNRPEASGARFICLDCAKRLSREYEGAEPLDIGPLTEAQRRELVAQGIDADAAQHFLDTEVRAHLGLKPK